MSHWWCIMLVILMTCICFLCDISRFHEASSLAGYFISEPDCQPVLRLPLYVPQLDMNCWRVCCCSLDLTCTEWVSLWSSTHSVMSVDLEVIQQCQKSFWQLLIVCWCLVKIQMSADRFSTAYLPFDWSYEKTVWWNQMLHLFEFVIHDCLKILWLLWSGLVSSFGSSLLLLHEHRCMCNWFKKLKSCTDAWWLFKSHSVKCAITVLFIQCCLDTEGHVFTCTDCDECITTPSWIALLVLYNSQKLENSRHHVIYVVYSYNFALLKYVQIFSL